MRARGGAWGAWGVAQYRWKETSDSVSLPSGAWLACDGDHVRGPCWPVGGDPGGNGGMGGTRGGGGEGGAGGAGGGGRACASWWSANDSVIECAIAQSGLSSHAFRHWLSIGSS